MSLVSDIDALVEYVKKIHRAWSDAAAMDELARLDMAVYVGCARADLLIHLPNPGPTRNSYNELFGKTKIYVSTACGPNCIVHASGQWLSDMEALRMLAKDVEPKKEKLQTRSDKRSGKWAKLLEVYDKERESDPDAAEDEVRQKAVERYNKDFAGKDRPNGKGKYERAERVNLKSALGHRRDKR